MEIKVITDGTPTTTYLFEGDDVMYSFKWFTDREEFLKLYKEETGICSASIIGIPDSYWGEKEIDAGDFVSLLFFPKGYEEVGRVLILKNCRIYITNKGNTIDVIAC
jgi:hypothetical protein